jgi:UDP-N-acetylglucosamine 2-epimerase (non-hydrolysing)
MDTTVDDGLSTGARLPIRVLCVIGTRPEVIKMAPVVRRLRADSERFQVHVLFTGQHRELLTEAARNMGVHFEENLDVMTPDQSLSSLLSKLLLGIDRTLRSFQPNIALAQGDTTSVLATALAANHRKVPFAHLEAGLRTADRNTPFPEEANRRLASVLTDLHFAPTKAARDSLLAENIPAHLITVTGNTVVDALLETLERPLSLPVDVAPGRLLALMTVHRRESFGPGIERIFSAVRRLADQNPDVDFVYPVHPNPNVRRKAHEFLRGVPNVRLIEPVEYDGFVALMARAAVILTDSGGVQEEAPSLGTPILVLRESTERPEGVAAGCAKLVGTDEQAIISAANSVLSARREGILRQPPQNPYGDGRAADRVVEAMWRRCCAASGTPFRHVA